jgi:hypothetical protein
MKLKIYQVKEECLSRFGFRRYDVARKNGFSLANYDCVWSGDIDCDTSLDGIYRRFNRVDEDDCESLSGIGFAGRSMSVSDVIDLEGHMYYCDDFGWIELKNEI